MSNLKKARVKLELSKLKTAKEEMDFTILKLMDEVEKVKKNIDIQENAINEKQLELNNLIEEK